jgi:hypothetical protein
MFYSYHCLYPFLKNCTIYFPVTATRILLAGLRMVNHSRFFIVPASCMKLLPGSSNVSRNTHLNEFATSLIIFLFRYKMDKFSAPIKSVWLQSSLQEKRLFSNLLPSSLPKISRTFTSRNGTSAH